MDLDRIIQIGTAAAYEAGKVLRRHFGHVSRIKTKGEVELVTEADIASERVIHDTIRRAFPDHQILAEESGLESGSSSEFRWIVDPLDGTTNFAHRLPIFCVSIGFARETELLAGIVLAPISGELFTATAGRGAFMNGDPIRVSQTAQLSESLIVTGFPYNKKEIVKVLMSRLEQCMGACRGIRRLGSAALDLCYVACGRFDGFWEQNLKPWDTAAGVLVLRESGGVVTDFSNVPFRVDDRELLATNGRIHDHLLSVLTID